MNRKIRSLMALVLCTVLTAAAVLDTMPCGAYAVTQAEIDALKEERDAIRAQRQEKQAIVEQLEADKASVVEQKRAMDERNMYTLQQIQLNSDEIALYDEMIADKEKELVEAERLEKEQLDRYRSRVRAMEENGSLGYLALILKTTSLGELLTAMDDIGEIMESDKELEDAYIAARKNTEEVKAEYEEYRADINAKQDVLRAEQAELEKDIEEAINLILDIQNNLEERQAEYDEIMAAEDAANANIDKLVAELEAQRRAEQANNGGGSSGAGSGANSTGSFIWPVASYVYVSSRFGQRVHPITGEIKNHTGIDIASNQGTTIYAADGGTITLAAWNGGYGNCVMIDHGNGYVTLYGHMSSIAVSQGQTVSQGDTIGYVGSTGNSTGPHLHFEVLKNGTRIDPEQFFSGLVISADAGV
ncbi:MAG: peptidoglycan DD-metalloendopeptidase family protein [Candidatus Limivicinus sp.]|nr:peptidoglycan DD-metalloendopeptidase family protein [Clostridiales bacterium]MDY3859461.1 peptidoglycan DD-metalloendopeptidase family protein [Candidatus Limivicinus sp.]